MTAESFGEALAHFRRRDQLSQLALSKRSGVHASIINRFERGERQPADRDMIDRLADALQLTPAERDRLLAAAGFFPSAIKLIGAADPDLLLVADILANEALPRQERDEFRTVLRILARRWQADGRSRPGD